MFSCSAPLAFLLLIIFAEGMYAQQNEASIKGKVILPQSALQQSTRRDPYQRGGRVVSSSQQEPMLVIWLESKHNVQVPMVQVLNQTDLKFVPAILPLRIGSTVNIINSDPVYHNVFSLSKTKKFDVGRRPKGEVYPVLFEQLGLVDVFCDIHSNMQAVILVLPESAHSWQVVQSGKEFELNGLYAGRYELKIMNGSTLVLNKTIDLTQNERLELGVLQL